MRNLLINEIYRSAGLEEMSAKKGDGGSDAAYTTIAGIPTIDSCGVDGGQIHSVNEYSHIKSLGESAKCLVAAAYCL